MNINYRLKRIIIFTPNVPLLIGFYSDLIGEEETYIDADGKWGEIISGRVNIAFHHSKKHLTDEMKFKIVFYSDDVEATRKELLLGGFKPGKIIKSNELMFCNLKDPDGNVLQFSNRK